MSSVNTAHVDQQEMPDHTEVWLAPEDEEKLRRDIDHQLFCKEVFHQDLLQSIEGLDRPEVLEVGAGSSIDSHWLAANSGARVHALDSAWTSTRLARRVGRHFRRPVILHQGDALSTPFASGTFDMVFHQGLLEHFADPLPLLSENLRILKTGGILVVDVPQRYSLYTVLKHRKMRRGEWPWGWEREYTADEMRELTRGMPMELVRLSSWGYDFYSSLMRWPWEKFQRRNPLRNTSLFNSLDRIYHRACAPIWEGPWRLIERRFGPHFMMNVTGIYRRTS